MNKKSLFLLLLLVMIFMGTGYSQPTELSGLWVVDNVSVGGQSMTPVARWFRINEDGTFQSGNGWMQHSYGTWEYDENDQSYLPVTKNGVIDEFGSFNVQFENSKMMWQREEEGMNVTVILSRAVELPKAPADLIQGLWGLEQILNEGQNATHSLNPENQRYIYFGWDRRYRERTANGERRTGYWHMDGHRPEITLMSHHEGVPVETWQVTVNDSTLLLNGLSQTNQQHELTFQRLHQYPD